MNSRLTDPINFSTDAWLTAGEIISAEEFRSFFKSFKQSAFRLETLPAYAVSHEDIHFAAYVGGAKEPPFIFQDWKNTIAAATTEGKTFEVIRVVPNPLTTYFKYELEWHYLEYKSAGQETKFLLSNQISAELRPALERDYWLFDDSTAIAMLYDKSGNIESRCKITNPSWIEQLRKWKMLSQDESISMKSYLQIFNESK